MPGENIFDWSTTAASNASADSAINWAEGQARASVNDSSRSMMAAHAKLRNLWNGSITTGGAANAQTFSSGYSFISTTLPTGFRALLKIGPALTNTGAATLNCDGIGAVAIKSAGVDISAGMLVAGTYQEFLWDGTNWILCQPHGGIGYNLRTVTATTTYPAVTNGTVQVLCYVKGAGGSGGGSSSAGRFGGGGGEGEEAWALYSASQLSGQILSIGAGGAAIAANTNSAGNSGGFSSIFGLVQANGGAGGDTGANGGAGGAGGSGGASNATCWVMPGARGHPGADLSLGTVAIWAAGGGKGGGSLAGAAIANSGGGGGGGSTGAASGAGASGFIAFLEFGKIA